MQDLIHDMGPRMLREGKAPMAHPTFGFRTFKGQGSRLLRDTDNDWVNIQAREGTAGWKKGLLLLGTMHTRRKESTVLSICTGTSACDSQA
jgi:hypothetical protein